MTRNIMNLIALALIIVGCSTQNTQAGKMSDKKVVEIEKAASVPAVVTPTTAMEIAAEENPRYIISVTLGGEKLGEIVIELFPKIAPKHVHNFDSLARVGFYDGTLFHRIVPGFVIQGGDPNTKTQERNKWGQGDPTQTKVPAEFSDYKHVRGTVSAARRGNDVNSATSQFFICVDDTPSLDNAYTAYGKVVSGMEIVDKIVELARDDKDRPIERIEMKIKKL